MKLFLIPLLLLPTLAFAQTQGTQFDRIDARGQVKTDVFLNRAVINMVGATPSVASGNVFLTNNPGVVTVTNFLGGADTQLITINCGDANTTIQNNANIVNASGADFACGVNKTISYNYFSALGKWVQSGTGSAGGGGGGGSPGAPANCLQKNNGAGAFGCSGESSDGTTFIVSEDQQNKGPNPYFNILNYGAYSNASPSTATCSITAASTALSCVSNPDFANGHGIVIPKAGAATALATPPQATVTPIGILNGATTYSYQIVAEDRSGGLTAASAAGTTATGAASLGPTATSITLTSCVTTDGTTGTIGGSIATYTSSGNHNLQTGAQVDIEGFTGGVFDSCNGVVTVVTTPTGTTFTVFKGQIAAETNTTGTPTAKVYACNELTFAASSVSFNTQIRYWIYRNNVLVGVQPGLDPHYIDCGLTVNQFPAYVPSTPPGSPQVGYLATTIVSGGGTTSLVLANAATTTAASQVVLHDNIPALRAAIQAAFTTGGGTVYIPNGGAFVFNSIFDSTAGFSNSFSRSIRIQWNNNFSSINQPWILRSYMSIEGDPHEATSFQYVQGPHIAGTAHPMLYVVEGQVAIYLKRIQLNSAGVLQTAFMSDEGTDGGAVTGIVFDDVSFVGNNGNSKPLVIRGGFDFHWTRGLCAMQGSGLKPSYCTTFSRSSSALTGAGNSQIIGRVKFERVFFDSSGIEFDCRGTSSLAAATSYIFNNSLMENVSMPYVKTTGCGTSQFSGIQINNLDLADNFTGCSTPVVDSALGGITSLSVSGGAQGCATPATFITTAASKASLTGGFSPNPGNVDRVSHLAGSQTNTRSFYRLATLPAPSVAVSAGGNVPIGTNTYQTAAVDIDGNETALSPDATCVTTSGNQTCTVTAPTLPSGSVGWRAFRGRGPVATGFCPGFLTTGVNYVDTFAFLCGNTSQVDGNGGVSLAGQSVVGPSGVSTPNLRLMGSGFTTTITPDSTANRTVAYPAASGTVCLTAACAVNSITVNGDAALTSSPRAVPPVFFPGALTTTWIGASWTLDKAITVTRVQSAAKVAPAGCSTSAVVRVTDGVTPINLTINAATNDSGATSQNYAAGATITVSISTAAAGCTTSPGDLNLSITSRMQ